MEESSNPWQDAEEGWTALVAASEKIRAAAKAIQKTERSIDGYNIEKSLNKHKPDLMREHMEGLKLHRVEN
jgi:hypothetical protein